MLKASLSRGATINPGPPKRGMKEKASASQTALAGTVVPSGWLFCVPPLLAGGSSEFSEYAVILVIWSRSEI